MDEDKEFYQELMATFREDAQERIKTLSQAVVELEHADEEDSPQGPVETLYREVHSLKGAAAAVEQALMASVCQAMESVLASLKGNKLKLDAGVIDSLSRGVDSLQVCLASGESGAAASGATVLQELETLVSKDRDYSGKKPKKKASSPVAPDKPKRTSAKNVKKKPAPKRAPASEEPRQGAKPTTSNEAANGSSTANSGATNGGATNSSVRVSISKLEALMLQAEEFISVKLSAGRRSSSLLALNSRMETWRREWQQASASEDPHKLEEFLQWNSTFMEGLTVEIRTLAESAFEDNHSIGPMVNDLVDGMKRVLMLPVSSLLSTFPKMIRDLARSMDKKVQLTITGAEIDIDKRVIENLKDPLTHLLRNSVDHGIETPKVRQGQGKQAQGSILIAVSQLENNKIEILVSDDGAGIDVRELRDAAVHSGIRTRTQVNAENEVESLHLAFASGLSTSAAVSEISGRGLGLAIVEEKVASLGGTVVIETSVGKGASFRITVPATLATTRGILAQVSDWSFVVPAVKVDRVARIHRDAVKSVENRETIQLDGRTVPLVRMSEALEMPIKPKYSDSDQIQVIVVGNVDDQIGLVVDSVLAEQEVLVKTLGPQLVRVPGIAGGTVIGSGKVVPIVEIGDLVRLTTRAAARTGRARPSTNDVDTPKKSVLVVEDSITSRILLKNLLEAAGYCVKPTVDGLDALAALDEQDFDLVICDIEMPRMDGIELTSRIRRETRWASLPVILVTALESQEDKERGLGAGANAYLPKSSFTQGTLLKMTRSLL